MQVLINQNNELILSNEICNQIYEFEKQVKEIEEKEKALKKAILEGMEENGLIKIDNEQMTITYLASHDRESFDSKTFRKENPELYDAYVKFSKVSPSLRIKIK